ncbi:MAG: hypothetical protein H7Z76_08810 [Methylotenera sp.]|nr:hypothetical protein [Flavobacterium sp.]
MAKSNNDERYFNFPIQLLKGFMIDEKEVLTNICDYAVYKKSLDLILGETEFENMKDSERYFGISLTSIDRSLKNGLSLYNNIPVNSPKVGLSKLMFFDFYKNDKSEFDKICLLGFLAIKSILGAKVYTKLDNKFWLSRMDGNPKSVKDYSELSKEVRVFANEYQTRKIKTALRDNWGLVTYSRYTRGFYVSYSLTLEQLMYEAEKRRKSTIEKQNKVQEKEALKRVLERIKNEQP